MRINDTRCRTQVKQMAEGRVHIIGAREDVLMSPNVMGKLGMQYGIEPDIISNSGEWQVDSVG